MAVSPIPDGLKQQFECPLSQHVMENPVTENTACRHTFERIWIEQWLTISPSCPISRANLAIANLQPNNIIQTACAIVNRNEPVNEADMAFLLKAAETLGNHADHRNALNPIRTRILETFNAAQQVAMTGTRAATDCVGRLC